MQTRRSGILLHITSLPSPCGIGDLGKGAYQFADFLSDAGQTIWQVLPLNPTAAVYGNSPYSSCSAFAGNPLLISPQLLVEEGYLLQADVENCPSFPAGRVEYGAVAQYKAGLFRTAFERYRGRDGVDCAFEEFSRENACWLNDYALFVALKEFFTGAPWNEWPEGVRDRVVTALEDWGGRLSERIALEKFSQFLFYRQWQSFKKYCNARNIQIIGDVPIYMSFDSVDVWANPGIFKLDERKNPIFVAGVPPDYFSKTGQLWGNPVYDWDVLKEMHFGWWVDRFAHNLKLFDMVRLDHFRGFVGFWEVPNSEKTAINGKWASAPARDFFDTLLKRFPSLPIVAEDLGIITPDVKEIMALYGYPGMKLLHFAFGEDLPRNPYAPHNHTRNCVVYTGTHDNNTTRGWFTNEVSKGDRERLFQYVGRTIPEEEIHLELMRLAMMSVSDTAVIPMQDVLGLGEEARMNMPSVAHGNWEWRLLLEQLTPVVVEKFSAMTRLYGRA